MKKASPLAIPMPIGGYFLALFALLGVHGAGGMLMMMREGGIGSYLVILVGFGAAAGAGTAVGLGAPRAIGVVGAALAWIVGGLFAMLGMAKVVSAIAVVSAADKATMLAAGTAEVSSLTMLAASLSAGTLLATAVAFILRAGQEEWRARALAAACVALLVGGVALADALHASVLRRALATLAYVSAADRATVAVGAASSNLAMIGWGIAVVGAVGCVAFVGLKLREVAPLGLVVSLLALCGALPSRSIERSALALMPSVDSELAVRFPGTQLLAVDSGQQSGVLGDSTVSQPKIEKSAEAWDVPAYLVNASATSDDLVRFTEELAKNDVERVRLQARAATPTVTTGEPLLDALLARQALREVEVLVCKPELVRGRVLYALGSGASWQIEDKDDVRIVRVAPGAPASPQARAILDADPSAPLCIGAHLGTPADAWSTAAALAQLELRPGLVGTLPPVDKVPGVPGDREIAMSALASLGLLGPDSPATIDGARSDTPVILGSLDKEVIRRVVKRYTPKIQFCYERELNRDPSLAGKITMKWVINGEGRVVQAQVAQTSMRNANVEQCMTSAIKQMEFPKPKGGGIVIVNYPFTFKSM